jgi:hypothetical protein
VDFTFGPRDEPCLHWASPHAIKLLCFSKLGNSPYELVHTSCILINIHLDIGLVAVRLASTPHFLASASAIATSTAGLPRGPRRPERLGLRGAGYSLDERLCLPNNSYIETGWLAILCRLIIMCPPAGQYASQRTDPRCRHRAGSNKTM